MKSTNIETDDYFKNKEESRSFCAVMIKNDEQKLKEYLEQNQSVSYDSLSDLYFYLTITDQNISSSTRIVFGGLRQKTPNPPYELLASGN